MNTYICTAYTPCGADITFEVKAADDAQAVNQAQNVIALLNIGSLRAGQVSCRIEQLRLPSAAQMRRFYCALAAILWLAVLAAWLVFYLSSQSVGLAVASFAVTSIILFEAFDIDGQRAYIKALKSDEDSL